MDIEEVQRRLWKESGEHKANREASMPLFPTDPYDMRARKLMDLMHNPTWLRDAAERTLQRSLGKAPGIDKVTVSEFRKKLEANLEELRLELKRGIYQPRPVRQVLIPKANGKMRPLGIPCLRDKIVQEAIRMALEPIFEVEFHDHSYGFRPNRSAHYAVWQCQQLMWQKFTWVIEGDVKACFDNISHKAILKVLREKILDNRFLELIKRFLKAGVSVEGCFQPTENGVPQGGVISPLLANAVLNKLDWFLHGKGKHGKETRRSRAQGQPNVRFVRFADDWCVFITRGSKQYAQRLRRDIEVFLRRLCGLELSIEKTRITHVRDGFDFLGFSLLQGVGRKGNLVPKIKVGRKGIQHFRRMIDDAARNVANHVSIAARIYRATMAVKGWGEYFRIAHNYYKVAGDLDNYVHLSMLKAICNKQDITTAQCYRRYCNQGTFHYKKEEYLGKLSDKRLKLYRDRPKPYVPGGKNPHADDMELELERRSCLEHKRPGGWDRKLDQLERDRHRCRQCGQRVRSSTSELDHTTPVREYPNYAAANHRDNLQTLCLGCHKRKHAPRQG